MIRTRTTCHSSCLLFFLFFFLFSKHTKCVLTYSFSKQSRLSLTRKMPRSRAGLQSTRSTQLLGIKSWPSACVCWMTIPTACATTRSASAPARLCSQYWNKHRMGSKTPHALVPPAQIEIVLTLKTVHSGWTLSQSIGYRGLPRAQKRLKLRTTNDVCVCALVFNFPCSGRLRDSPHHPPKTHPWPPRLSIAPMQTLYILFLPNSR